MINTKKASVVIDLWLKAHGNQKLGFKVTVYNPQKKTEVRMPEWTPGYYANIEYERDINYTNITHNGKEYDLDRDVTYQMDETGVMYIHLGDNHKFSEPLVIEGELSATKSDVHTNYVSRDFYVTNLVSLPFIAGRDEHCGIINFIKPQDDQHYSYQEWQLKAPVRLNALEVDSQGFGSYCFEQWISFADIVVTAGKTITGQFECRGAQHFIHVLGAPYDFSMEKLVKDTKGIVDYVVGIFEPKASYERYDFTINVEDWQGGLEHKFGSYNIMGPQTLPQVNSAGELTNPMQYIRLAGLLAHEYVHRYVVKSLRFYKTTLDVLQKTLRTPRLWFFEGLTDYLGYMSLVGSNLITVEQFMVMLSLPISGWFQTTGRNKHSLATASLCTHTHFQDTLSRTDPNAKNDSQDYYTGGKLIAFALDIQCMINTQGKKSLKDGLRILWERYGKNDIPIPKGEIENAFDEACGVGEDWFNAALRSTTPLDLAPYLKAVGVRMHMRPKMSRYDRGGSTKPVSNAVVGWLGCEVNRDNVITRNYEGNSPTAMARILPGSKILSCEINKQSIDLSSNDTDIIAECANSAPGATMHVEFERRGVKNLIELKLGESPLDTCDLRLMDDLLDTQKQYRELWVSNRSDVC